MVKLTTTYYFLLFYFLCPGISQPPSTMTQVAETNKGFVEVLAVALEPIYILYV